MATDDGGGDAGLHADPGDLSVAARSGDRELEAVEDQTSHLLPLVGDHNVRDLGGYPCADGGVTAWGRIFRGDAMAWLDEAGLERLLATGLSTVVDIRSAAELDRQPPRLADRPGIAWHHVPLYDRLAPLHEMQAEPGFSMARRYIAGLDSCGAAFAEVLELIAGAEGPVLFNCTAGKDRTGLVAAMILLLSQVGTDDVLRDYARTETEGAALLKRLRTVVGSVRGGVLSARPDMLAPALSHLDAVHGGVRNYLVAAGMRESAVDRLAARLRE